MDESVPALPVQLTVHSISVRTPKKKRALLTKADAICVGKASALVALQQTPDILYFMARFPECAPVVSSTLSIGGFSPESQDSGLFS
ncbi:hypothetical protein ACSFA0_05480 [Variovorax sp. LT1P1]|uniref:hypothetical protein n=1 Tax=Variovorax sp. LT1P1 TaxID=3443730 RepID=UPI003F486124